MKNFFTEIISPLDQFEIKDLITLDAPILANIHLSLTNIALYLVIGTLIAITFNVIATNSNKVVSNS